MKKILVTGDSFSLYTSQTGHWTDSWVNRHNIDAEIDYQGIAGTNYINLNSYINERINLSEYSDVILHYTDLLRLDTVQYPGDEGAVDRLAYVNSELTINNREPWMGHERNITRADGGNFVQMFGAYPTNPGAINYDPTCWEVYKYVSLPWVMTANFLALKDLMNTFREHDVRVFGIVSWWLKTYEGIEYQDIKPDLAWVMLPNPDVLEMDAENHISRQGADEIADNWQQYLTDNNISI